MAYTPNPLAVKLAEETHYSVVYIDAALARIASCKIGHMAESLIRDCAEKDLQYGGGTVALDSALNVLESVKPTSSDFAAQVQAVKDKKTYGNRARRRLAQRGRKK
jgi:hypothetical protein